VKLLLWLSLNLSILWITCKMRMTTWGSYWVSFLDKNRNLEWKLLSSISNLRWSVRAVVRTDTKLETSQFWHKPDTRTCGNPNPTTCWENLTQPQIHPYLHPRQTTSKSQSSWCLRGWEVGWETTAKGEPTTTMKTKTNSVPLWVLWEGWPSRGVLL
jgi:hypothetical protein